MVNELTSVSGEITGELVYREKPVIQAAETIFVNEFTDGVLNPNAPMLGPLKDGGRLLPIQLLAVGAQ